MFCDFVQRNIRVSFQSLYFFYPFFLVFEGLPIISILNNVQIQDLISGVLSL